jgi:hypothetical protein
VCDLKFTTGLAEPDSRGLVPAIHAAPLQKNSQIRPQPHGLDGRDKPGQDGCGSK